MMRPSALHTMSRSRRRVFVLVMQAGMVGWVVTLALAGASSWWIVALILPLEALYLVMFFKVLSPIMREVIRKSPDLDERQLSVRDRAHYHAYRVLGAVLVTLACAPLAGGLYFGVELPLTLTHWHFQGLFLFFANLNLSLPASVVAWTEPDPEPER